MKVPTYAVNLLVAGKLATGSIGAGGAQSLDTEVERHLEALSPPQAQVLTVARKVQGGF